MFSGSIKHHKINRKFRVSILERVKSKLICGLNTYYFLCSHESFHKSPFDNYCAWMPTITSLSHQNCLWRNQFSTRRHSNSLGSMWTLDKSNVFWTNFRITRKIFEWNYAKYPQLHTKTTWKVNYGIVNFVIKRKISPKGKMTIRYIDENGMYRVKTDAYFSSTYFNVISLISYCCV